MPYLCMLFYLHQGVWPAWCITGSASTQENWQEISTWTLLHQDWWKFPRIFLPQFWSRGKSVCKNLGEKGKKKELKFNLLESEKKDEWHNIYLVSLDLVNIKKASILLLIWFDVCNCNFTFFFYSFSKLRVNRRFPLVVYYIIGGISLIGVFITLVAGKKNWKR